MGAIGEDNHKKRKLLDGPELEIDVSAPEPASKKALRKAKKKTGDDAVKTTDSAETTTKPAENTEGAESTDVAPQKRSDYGIWIGNLAFSVSKDDVKRFLISNCSFTEATITRIHMPKPSDKNSRAQNKGFAYVDFSTAKAAEEALGLSEHMVTGRRVLIKDAKNYQGRPDRAQADGKDTPSAGAAARPPSKRVFVGNLSFDATKELLEEHFSKCGTIANVHMATFQDSGKCKGYAWVEFDDLEAAETAARGYKFVTEDDDEEDESESMPSKKPQRRKIWLNQILGRRMRIEFAEDATTRYNKRFGKNIEGKRTTGNNGEAEPGDFEEVAAEEKPHRQPTKAKHAKPDYTRYDQSTVQKMSGAMVEGQGKKTTFG